MTNEQELSELELVLRFWKRNKSAVGKVLKVEWDAQPGTTEPWLKVIGELNTLYVPARTVTIATILFKEFGVYDRE